MALFIFQFTRIAISGMRQIAIVVHLSVFLAIAALAWSDSLSRNRESLGGSQHLIL
jgi:hypothetical protein